jgi:hypothetical protein
VARPFIEEHTMQHTLRNALPIVAAALGRKFGVEVGVGGQNACTDGRRIQIPDVSDDPASRDLAWGYLAHEAAHVCYTDFRVYELAAREGPLQEMLQNRIEDVRIERELARPYPGTRTTIVKVLRRMLAECRMSAPEPGDHPAQVLAAYLLLTLRHEVLNQTVFAGETVGESVRTEIDQVSCYADEVRWSAAVRHTDMTFSTEEIPVSRLMEIAEQGRESQSPSP